MLLLFTLFPNISTFVNCSSLYVVTLVPIVGVVNVILLIDLSILKSNFSATYNPISISLTFESVTFTTSAIPAILFSPSNTMLISIESEFNPSSTPSA